MDMLSVRQVRTLRCPLSGEGEEQGWLQAPIEDGQQAPIEARSQAQVLEHGRAWIEEDGRPWQEGPTDGRSKRRRLQLGLFFLEL
jgi:hypothetical protein